MEEQNNLNNEIQVNNNQQVNITEQPKKTKFPILIILLIIFVAVGSGFGGYYIAKKNIKTEEKEEPQPVKEQLEFNANDVEIANNRSISNYEYSARPQYDKNYYLGDYEDNMFINRTGSCIDEEHQVKENCDEKYEIDVTSTYKVNVKLEIRNNKPSLYINEKQMDYEFIENETLYTTITPIRVGKKYYIIVLLGTKKLFILDYEGNKLNELDGRGNILFSTLDTKPVIIIEEEPFNKNFNKYLFVGENEIHDLEKSVIEKPFEDILLTGWNW